MKKVDFKSCMKSTGDWFKSLFAVTNEKEPKMLTFYKKSGTKSVIASLISVLAGLVVGFILMLIIAAASDAITIYDAFNGLGILLAGPFTGTSSFVLTNFGDMIFYAGPLIMCGLSVAIAFKTGLFNIGAAGQFLMGTMGALLVALNINTTGNPAAGFFVWLFALLVGTAFGFIWGAIPGLFKALFGVNEVIVCIMTNWIAANIVSWVFSSTPHLINTGGGKSNYLITTAVTGNGTPDLGLGKLFNGSYLDFGIFIAIILAIVIFIVLNKTTFGYELKACGSNKFSAKYAGMNEKRNIVLSMAIAGALASIGGCIYYLNPGIEFNWGSTYMSLPAYGFNGIPVALLASSNPLGVIFAGVFLRYLAKGGDSLVTANYNRYVSDIIIAVIIYFAGFSRFIIDILTKQQRKMTEKVNIKIAKAKETPKEENSEPAFDVATDEQNPAEGEQGETLDEVEKEEPAVPVEENNGKGV